MNIQQLLHGIVSTELDFTIKDVCLNSQQVQNGDVFVALQGAKNHGADYIEQAIDKGCVCVLIDSKEVECRVPSVCIDDLSAHLPALAQNRYADALKVEVVGVTGTNGKTSVASFISQLLEQLGVKNGLIGTLGISQSEQLSTQTTPDILTLYRTLDGYFKDNITTAVLEVSSHGIHQNRIAGLNIAYAVFTNLTQDHLDYHQDLRTYQEVKQQLFLLPSVKTAILNRDDSYYADFEKVAKNKKRINFGLNDFDNINLIEQGFLVTLQSYVFEVPFLGEFNLSNILAAFNTVKSIGFDAQKIIPLLHKLTPPPGRMQKINNRLVWVDYAHTPDAIQNAISTLKQHYPQHKIRVVFGCGGNRDQDKRGKMGKIASKLADTLILTNDNPREEDPQAIINDILTGIDDSYEVGITLDRQLAIETAVTEIGENECLLIAGKGHETTQQFKDKIIQLSDIDIAKKAK
ncbi:UDP-N-acetylmuramoylalanyl-D-glutamate--2,6-diaminopimelate ligase [uncultured Candidatus Thioglobus sp.]|nr:UDP-N-acetylmuramoylalanyl-D-glutamate--2,6-diaminopimelate ligase [uncultured Candidatus Thioglobus sp.]